MNTNLLDHRLWIIGAHKTLPVGVVWAAYAAGALSGRGKVSVRSNFVNKSDIDLAEVFGLMGSNIVEFLEITGSGFNFNFLQNGGADLDQIQIDSDADRLQPMFADRLVKSVLAMNPAFTQASLVDRRYEHMQNMYDPLQFRALGIPINALPMKSNGLPPPLEKK